MSARLLLALLSVPLILAGPASANPLPRLQSAAPYSNSTEGLHELVLDMLGAAKNGNPQALGAYLQALALPNSASWCVNVFGEDNGRQVATFYDSWASFRDSQLSGDLARAIAAQMTDIRVLRFDKPGDPGTTDKDNYFLGLRQQPEPFYAVLFKSASGASMRWFYFVYADGVFRYLGPLPDLRIAGNSAAQPAVNPAAEIPKRIRLGSNVAEARLIHRVQPVYPPDALQKRLEGTVVLHAIIAPDGSVQSVALAEGNPVFADAAEAAIKQWRYEPVLLNGSPIAVDTTITVKFALPPMSAASNPSGTSAGAAPAIPSYPDSSGGLTKMMKTVLELAQHGNNQLLASYYRALVLPNPETWFPAQFGDRPGTQFAESYESMEQVLQETFANAIQSDAGLKFDRVEVRRFKDSCDLEANEFEYPILAAREKQSTPLYEVRFVKDLSYRWLFPFAYVDGGFRYLGGNLQIQAPKNQILIPQPSEDGSTSNDVQWPKAIHQVPPIFPQGINQVRNAALVKLWGVIGTDGSVRDLHVIEGTCAFAKATMDAVKKWRYTPLMVHGKPQELIYPFQYSFGPGQ